MNSNAVWDELQSEIRAWMSQRGWGDQVYLTEGPNEAVTAPYAVQIIPRGDAAMHPKSGAALVEVTIDIVVWWRNLLDPVAQASIRIGGDDGVEQFVEGLRILLNGNRLNNTLTIPMVWRNGGTVEAVSELEGWMRATETFGCAYAPEWGY
jgi:hypothetical protein